MHINETLIDLLRRSSAIEAPASDVVLNFDSGLDLSLVANIIPLLSDNGCYVGEKEYKGPWKDETVKNVELLLNRKKLRQHNIICRPTLGDYISNDLGISRYRGFLNANHVTVILDLNFYSFNGDEVPEHLKEAENCCVLFDEIQDMADLKNGNTIFFLLEEPLEITKYEFNNAIIKPVKTDYHKFTHYFSESREEKRACLKVQLMKYLKTARPDDRLEVLFDHFDEIFKNASLSYDRILALSGEERLTAQLQKETQEFLERSKSILESLKSEIIVLATKAIGFGYLDFSNVYSSKNILILITLVLIDIVFTIVLCNGLDSLNQLKDSVYERKEILEKSNTAASKSSIEMKTAEFLNSIRRSKKQFWFCIILLWLPLALLLCTFLNVRIPK